MTPPSDREDTLCAMFESFCITVIRNFGRNLKRTMKNRQKHDSAGGEPVEYFLGLLSAEDECMADKYILEVDGLPCVLENELLYDALLSLPDRERRVILYDFWYSWTDKEISKKLEVRCARCITVSSVRLRKSVHIMSYTDRGQTHKLTYALIKRAAHGDKNALEKVILHFDPYINAVSTVVKTLPSGEDIQEVDEDRKIQIQMHLIKIIQEKWRELI